MGHSIVFQVLAPRTERLDRFLADQLSWSRTRAGRVIAAGQVRVNDRAGRAGHTLIRGDTVTVTVTDPAPGRDLPPHPVDLDIVYEDDALLVVDKPAGLVVHPAPGHRDDTLVNALIARGLRLSRGTGDRPGIVHRLDRDTSGLMVLARTEPVHRTLAGMLERREIRRIYAALVWGHLGGAPRTVEAPIARHPGDRKRMAVIATGRPARTRVEEVARFETCDLVRVTLDTGRTHQIRVHLAHIGHPVIGDPVYGGGGPRRVHPSRRREAERIAAATPRQALHAAVLRFAHPATGTPLEFRAAWPEDLGKGLAEAAGDPGLVARSNVLEYLGFVQHDG